VKLRAPPGPQGKAPNIKLSNEPNPLCDGSRPWVPELSRPHPVQKMMPWSRRGDEVQYMCHKCFKTEKIHEPATKRPNKYR
jgi:hypothetical protein